MLQNLELSTDGVGPAARIETFFTHLPKYYYDALRLKSFKLLYCGVAGFSFSLIGAL